jgi:hypothetical protein
MLTLAYARFCTMQMNIFPTMPTTLFTEFQFYLHLTLQCLTEVKKRNIFPTVPTAYNFTNIFHNFTIALDKSRSQNHSWSTFLFRAGMSHMP